MQSIKPSIAISNKVLCLTAAPFFKLLLLVAFSVIPIWTQSSVASDGLQLRQEHIDHLITLDSLRDGESDNKLLTNNNFLQDRVVLVTFFASWCPPCLDEFMVLNDIQRKLGTGNFTVVAVNVFEEFDENDETRMLNFLLKTRPEFFVVKGTDESKKLFGDINRIPTLIVFDKNGDEAFSFIHKRGATKRSVDSTELLNAIRPML